MERSQVHFLFVQMAISPAPANRAESVDAVAAAVGYAEGVTLRALLRRRLGRGVREIRSSD